jgi:hypothetical protein
MSELLSWLSSWYKGAHRGVSSFGIGCQSSHRRESHHSYLGGAPIQAKWYQFH